MQASFTPQEQQLIDQLREKYSGLKESQGAEEGDSCLRCVAGASDTGTAPRPSASTRTSNVDASVCPHCHGTGTIVEIYNHRRLENYCQHCDGRGVHVYRNGVEVKETSAARAATSSSTAQGPSGVVELHSRAAAAGDAGDTAERKAALERDLEKIAAKVAAYTKERLDALALMQRPGDISGSGSGGDPDGRDAAARALVAQLDLQLQRLEATRRRKQAELERLA